MALSMLHRLYEITSQPLCDLKTRDTMLRNLAQSLTFPLASRVTPGVGCKYSEWQSVCISLKTLLENNGVFHRWTIKQKSVVESSKCFSKRKLFKGLMDYSTNQNWEIPFLGHHIPKMQQTNTNVLERKWIKKYKR